MVLEDAVIGIQAAKSAGMRCIGIGRVNTPQADLIVDGLDEVTVSMVKSLLEREE